MADVQRRVVRPRSRRVGARVIWLSIPIAVCAWTCLVGRRNLSTRFGRALYLARLSALMAWHQGRKRLRRKVRAAAWHVIAESTGAQGTPPPGHPAARSMERTGRHA